jgi:phosphoglycolate phosphatase
MPLKAILFDLDGTLIQTRIDFKAMSQGVIDLALAAGAQPGDWQRKEVLGMVRAAALDLTSRNHNGADFSERAYAAIHEAEHAGCANPLLLPGTDDLLCRLTGRGIKIGIVTRNSRQTSLQILNQFQLHYDALLTRDDVISVKPDPQHLWDALHRLQCSPGEAIMVGDHWMDVQAGRRAGMAKTVGILGDHDPDWFAPCPPDILIRDLAEWPEIPAEASARQRGGRPLDHPN